MPEHSSEKSVGDTRLLEEFYLPFLLGAQNADGGWGYRHGGQSAVFVRSHAVATNGERDSGRRRLTT